jgi:hypothetical protein
MSVEEIATGGVTKAQPEIDQSTELLYGLDC